MGVRKFLCLSRTNVSCFVKYFIPLYRKTHLSVTCPSNPELDDYLEKPVFEHDPVSQDTRREGYKNRNLVCPEIHYEDKSDKMQFVLVKAEN